MAFEQTQEQINNLKTLQLSLSELTDDVNELAPKIVAVDNITKELSSGKQSIVDAINNAGGTASADESLAELAEDIETMPIVNVSAFKFSSVPNLAKQIAEQTYTGALSEDFRSKLTEINDIGGEITSVGAYAFYNCNNITKVNLPNVTSVVNNSFNCTSLTDLSIPKAVLYQLAARWASYITCRSINTSALAPLSTESIYGGNRNLISLTITSQFTTMSGWSNNAGRYFSFNLLIKFAIAQDNDIDLNLAQYQNGLMWTASTYLTSSADQWENRLLLYQNLLTYTISKLYDHSQDGVTRTMRLGFYTTLLADSQLTTEPYGSELTPLIKAAAQACLTEADNRGWTLSA